MSTEDAAKAQDLVRNIKHLATEIKGLWNVLPETKHQCETILQDCDKLTVIIGTGDSPRSSTGHSSGTGH